MLLGAHMSTAGGLETALERGQTVGCETIQIFTKNNNQWNAKPLSAEDSARFRGAAAKAPISPIFAHASYLINLGSPDKKLFTLYKAAFLDEMRRCAQIGLSFLVLHPGANRRPALRY